ncbi:MAG: HI0933 family protein [Candidatus Wolfebacteria bacterium GW2011_GWE1_48_7]|nr:MAG: HI0933 family protein [Candidatus Wolfebacteria bacterium GW2011_GWE1_48_7]
MVYLCISDGVCNLLFPRILVCSGDCQKRERCQKLKGGVQFTTMKKRNQFDVAVIGGGPAGMMAAGRAAELGARVILVEKNPELGKKLLITGGGRCNLTNAETDARKFIEKLGKNGKFFFSPIAAFGTRQAIDFFEGLGVKTKMEDRKRVFPDAADVLEALKSYMEKGGVTIATEATAAGFNKKEGRLTHLNLRGSEIEAQAYILATGGRSRPETGATGEGLKWASALGHTILNPFPALVPLKISDGWVKQTQGLSMDNIEVTLRVNGKKDSVRTGNILFTHFGMSGPAILDISKRVGEVLKDKTTEVLLTLDLKPALSVTQLDERVQKDFKKYQNKTFRNSLDDLLPRKLIPAIVKMSQINPNKPVHEITREDRLRLVKLLKDLRMSPIGLLGFDKAIASSGGVDLAEVDTKTMRSKILDNLYFAGDVLDIDAPTGGFNLQLCWSTGYVAGEAAARQTVERDEL